MKNNITYRVIDDFVNLAIENGAIEPLDKIYLRNQLLHFLDIQDWTAPERHRVEKNPWILMNQLKSFARENQLFSAETEEFFESALMDFVTPKPSKINQIFWEKYRENPQSATDYFYKLAREVNQVKTREISKNIAYKYPSKYGDLEITINLSKPEKDPKAIAAAKKISSSSYPACALCLENEGFYGFANKAARSNHRLIRMKLNGEDWAFQYSPYAYYNEHSIVLNHQHQPMKIDRRTFENLLDFLDQFPHYMIGSNADLPIVGGSILTHDHYQAGRHEFPMMKAKIREQIILNEFPEITAGIVDWPMSVLRLESSDRASLVAAANKILSKWQTYSDESLHISAVGADGSPHHTITPIARKKGNRYLMCLVLRDNNVSPAYPDGIFHPHQKLHHIKKENIGLIEVMGLAVLPPRLKVELVEVEKYLLDEPNQIKEIHLDWANQLKKNLTVTEENVAEQVQKAVGAVFEEVLQDAGIFKENQAGQAGFRKFVDFLND